MEALFAAKEIVIACGSGGVGKTTTAAAAAAMAASRLGGKVLVVTVDPARRLASALGLEGFGNDEKPVPPEAFKSGGVRPRGELWAAMLDTKQSWDDLVRRHAPDRVTASRILANPLYQNISGKFIQSHDYIAMERLYEIHSEGNFDLIVVDTPPTRNAIDFIEAPQRMAEFFSSRLLRLLIAPYRSRMVNMASRPFYQVADRVLGSQFLEDIAEFFILFQTMYSGFVERARAVERLLIDRRTTFVVVSTLEAAPVREAEFFIQVLTAKRFHLGALVLNKVLPDYLLDDAAEARATRLSDDAAELARSHGLAGLVQTDEAQLTRVLAEVGENFRNFSVVARRQAAQRHDLEARPDVVALVPEFDSDIRDLPGLLRLGERIWS
jgi:anion-transporting  ArsA/GET3 family ATPase